MKIHLSQICRFLFLVLLLCRLGCRVAFAAPDNSALAKPAGTSILFLSNDPRMDEQYAGELTNAGISYAVADLYKPLSYQTLKRFNLVVIDKLPHDDQEFQLFGQNMQVYWENMRSIWRCASEGAGVLVYTNLTDCGGSLNGGWNREMNRWGISMLQMCVRDHATAFEKFQVYGEQCYCWTENLARHPITQDLKRIYYPSVQGRWDDCYTAPPLICDKNWTPLVRGMSTATVFTEVDKKEITETDHKNDTILAAVRPVGKGRLGVLSINPAYIHRLGYSHSGQDSEIKYGVIDGIILSKGHEGVTSDTGKLVNNLYHWLSANSGANGFGGFKTGEKLPVATAQLSADAKAFNPMQDFDNLPMPPSWRHRASQVTFEGKNYWPEISDPFIKGPIKYLKALVGVHSVASDGAGTVSEYVVEARKAGYSLIFFTEAFDKLTPAKWEQLLRDCRDNTRADFACVPGIDIQDDSGNHFILAGIDALPRKSWLTPDGKRLVMTANINLLMHAHMVISHRVAEGPLPYERLKHFQGLTVFTYRNGKLVDDGTKAYKWQVMNGSNPHPIAVHETYSPKEVAGAAKTGYQQILPSDTPANAASYVKAGIGLYYDTPSRFVLSEGPTAYNFVIRSKDIGPSELNQDKFRVAIGIKSDAPLKVVELHDGEKVLRRWLPQGNDFQANVDFFHSQQYDFFVTAEDSRGKRLLTSSMRTVAQRYHSRCTDRQNWLGDGGLNYTGTNLPASQTIDMPVEGTKEGQGFFPDEAGANMAARLNFPFTSNDMVLTEMVINQKYVDALWDSGIHKVGYDATPSQASEPSSVYDAKMRYYSFTRGNRISPYISLIEFDITLKRDVQPINPAGLFPALGNLFGKKFGWLENGKLAIGDIADKATIPVPIGGMAGGYIALSPGLQVQDGRFGFAPLPGNPTTLKKGTHFVARYLLPTPAMSQARMEYSFDESTEEWLKAMGFDGPTPYQLTLTRGKQNGTTYFADITPEDYGIAGSVTTTAQIPFPVTLQMKGVNENWAAGIWRESENVCYSGAFENTIWPRLDVSKSGKFYAGNLLRADNRNLVLQILAWNKDRIKIEVHNPTDAAIEATISTPAEITDHKQFLKKVTVPAGTSLFLEG